MNSREAVFCIVEGVYSERSIVEPVIRPQALCSVKYGLQNNTQHHGKPVSSNLDPHKNCKT